MTKKPTKEVHKPLKKSNKKVRKNTSINSIEKLYSNIKQIIEEGKNNAYRAVNFAMVQTYWHIGKLIIEEEQSGKQRAEYGKSLLKALSDQLIKEYGKGFDESNLRHMRNFYNLYQKQDALRPELSWTHYRLLLKVEREDVRSFYMQESITCNWSTRTLERQVNSLYFERIIMTNGAEGKKLVKAEADTKKEIMQAKDIIKDPYVLEFLGMKSNTDFYESELEQAIIDKLQDFLLELGKGFSFVARQYRISVGPRKHFHADLVFYNYILKCFLVIDLKTDELTHQDIGQMDMYVRYFEDKVKQENDNPTIGLILCAEKNNTIVKYSLLSDSEQIFASQYKTYLPTEKQLKEEIAREREVIEREKRLNSKKLKKK
jgi:predicted nuclease of restriction endonuclease-like (RecB) superfamily